MNELTSGTANAIMHFEGGQRVYPCFCGVTHRGPYAFNDYWYHNCFHDEPLIQPGPPLTDDPREAFMFCPSCGKGFGLERGASPAEGVPADVE